MKICKNCNLLFEDHYGFCRKCGSKLELFQQNTQNGNIETVQNPDQNITSKESSASNNSLTIALVVAALLIGGIGSYIIFGRPSDETKEVANLPPGSTQQTQQITKETETKSTQNIKDIEIPVQRPIVNQNSPKEAFLSFHRAITDKQLEEAYNILSPEYQRYMKSFDSFANGYTTTLLSDVVELTTLHEDSNTASYAYKLKAVDREGSGTKTQYFAGKAKLINIDGRWRLDSTEAKRIRSQSDVNIQQSRYSEKTSVGYPYYLNGDPNCIIVAGHMGGAWYLVKNSIRSTSLSPTVRTVTADVVHVSNADKGNTAVSSRKTYTYYFNEKSGYASVNDQPINYNGPMYITRVVNPTGAMSYYIATGKKWFQFGYGNEFYSLAN